MESTPVSLDPPTNGTMGLKGSWAQLANLSAVALVCLMFWSGWQEFKQLVREDRAMFREALQRLHEDSASQYTAIKELTRAVEKLASKP